MTWHQIWHHLIYVGLMVYVGWVLGVVQGSSPDFWKNK